ncbi:MAG: SLC13 family permease [Gemmatimonadota bacterium]|nr:SLC13 family permease [Gemmatimonadota bacterium]
MTWQAWFTLGVTLLTLICLAKDLLAPANTMLGAAILLLLAGVITPGETFAGFGNPAPMTVAALYILARGAEKTGLLQPVLERLLGKGTGGRWALARLLVPSAAASAFLNNTPIVAMMIPQVLRWSDRVRVSASRYLMPLSFAVVLGGVITTIGTSTNLVVSGMLQQTGAAPLGMFEITRVGLPVAIIGLITLIVTVPWLQPDRRPARQQLEEGVREFTVAMKVVDGGPLDGVEVEIGGLRNLAGVFLAEIDRAGEVIAPVAPNQVLRGEDRLSFVGRADLVVDLQTRRGLVSAEVRHMNHFDTARHCFFQAIVGANSPLVGLSLKQVEFRSRYQAAVVAIHRSGQPIEAKLGEVTLKLGDTLLLLADPGFRDRWRDRNDFLMVAAMEGSPPAASKKAWLVGVIGLLVVVVAGAGFLPILQAALIGAVALVAFGVLTATEARNAIELDTIIVIAASFALGTAMERSGLAARAAGLMIGMTSGSGVHGALLGIVLATVVTTEIITNNAAAALLFPIAFASAQQLHSDPRAFAIAVAVAASNSFLTPIGYQTNTMVYGPGGYHFTDYIRVGLPLTITTVITTVLVIPWAWGL